MEKQALDEIYFQILKEELIPAMGCTEPIAIAYGAAKAREVLGQLPEKIAVACSPNIIKNVKSVVVPNTNGKKGIQSAVMAGMIAGHAEKELEVISKVTEDEKIAIEKALHTIPIEMSATTGDSTFEIHLDLTAQQNTVHLEISEFHTNIVLIEKNGEVLFEKKRSNKKTKKAPFVDRNLLTIADIVDFANCVPFESLKELFSEQVKANMAIAEEGLTHNYGANIGQTWLKFHEDTIENRAIAKAAAASDARMSGCELPVVINSGSGNQGITVSVPVVEYAKSLGFSDDQLYRALAVSNLIAIHEKSGIGRLSAYCGAVSAGCAAASGIAYLETGDVKAVSQTLSNALAVTSGMICDGAKASCAAKIATSVSTGFMGFEMYKNNHQVFESGDGIVGSDIEKTIHNVSRLGKDGMHQTDEKIIEIMLEAN